MCVSVCVCARMCIKMAHSMSAADPLREWINFSPQDCQSNIMTKTKLKKKKKNCREEELEHLSIFFFYLY